MSDIIREEIKKIYESFDTTGFFYEKGYVLTFFEYLNKIFPNDLDIIEMCNSIRLKMFLIREDYLSYLSSRRDDISRFMKNNSSFFDENIPKMEDKPVNIERNETPLSNENISYIIETFLKRTNKKMLEFYKKMKSEGRFFYCEENCIATTSLHEPNTIILVNDLKTMEDILIFLHEFAHAYYIYLNNYLVINRSGLLSEIKNEIPAKIIEIKFIKFLEDYKLVEQSKELENFFNSIMYECDNNRDDFDKLKTLIGSNIALYLKDKKIDIDKCFRSIYKNDIYDIIKECNNKKNKGKVLRK